MIKQKQIRDSLVSKLSRYFGMSPAEAGEEQIYKATVLTVRDILAQKNRAFSERVKAGEQKRVYYICLEFLVGRSLRLNLNNLGLEQAYREALADLGFDLDAIYEKEPDPGLGNGGLGRLAACFMDSLSTLAYPARGFSILYEYGLFRQRIVDGEQLELPDVWLPEGEVWLVPRQDRAVTVRFGGRVEERWENGVCHITQYDCDEVEAVPYDMFIPARTARPSACCGCGRRATSAISIWKPFRRGSISRPSRKTRWPRPSRRCSTRRITTPRASCCGCRSSISSSVRRCRISSTTILRSIKPLTTCPTRSPFTSTTRIPRS